MKILAVRLRNLNSLAGSWAIDFTAPEYAAAGIFAITGPTGAGKSTILDAICLALFARTPRLGHISKGSNEIMSRRAGDCFAEVEFETRQGRYRCHWAQHRARRSPGGELQPPRHEIVDAGSGRVLETRSKEVGRLVEEVTGMDYDRFTRSILLAQGDFAAFLEADADQRAPILEQITGTGVYSRISMAVHERTTEARRQTALLREAMGSVVLLGEEEERALTAAIDEGTVTAAGMQRQLALLAQSLHRLAAIASLEAQIAETDRLLLDLTRRREAAGDDLLKVERGRRGQALLGEYTQWTQTRERIAALRAKEVELRAAGARLRQEQARIVGEHGQACQAVREAVALRQRENETITEVRALDLRCHEKRQVIGQRPAARQQTEQERDQAQRQRQDLERQLAETNLRQAQLAAFFRDHGNDGLLVEHLAGFRQQLQQLREREDELTRLEQTHGKQQIAHAEAEQRCGGLRREAERAAQDLAVLRERQQGLEAEQATVLAGQPPSCWRSQLEQLEERLRQLEKAAELLGRQRSLEAEQAALACSLREAQERERRTNGELTALEEQRRLKQRLVAQGEDHVQLVVRIRSLEEERRHLRQGAPCPLCGATYHPWAETGPTVEAAEEPLVRARADLAETEAAIGQAREALAGLRKDIEHGGRALDKGERQQAELAAQQAPLRVRFGDETDVARLLAEASEQGTKLRCRLKAIDRLDGELHTLRIRVEQATARHTDLHSGVQAAEHAGETLAGELRQLEGRMHEARARIEAGRADLLRRLQPLGIDACPPGQTDRLLLELEARLQAWKGQQERSDRLTQHGIRLLAEQDKLDLLLATMGKTLAQQEAELAELCLEEAGLRAARAERYGDRDPDVEEQRLRVLVQEVEARELAIRTRLGELDKEVHGVDEQVRLGTEELATLLPRSRAQEADLLARLTAAGFVDVDDLRAALLPPATLARLGQLKDGLDQEQTALAARRAEQSAALGRERALEEGGKSREELLVEQAGLDRELAAVQQRIGADRERLAVDRRHRERLAEQRQALVAQNEELERWELLHLLIGSADGKKFRVFAQSLTFEVMISHANRQLRKMSDRYLLLLHPDESLALQVVDNYQAGEIRSTRNLSGGESFLVSLALALGLSAMASHNVRVDSLFLDEGFGSLDEEALNIALQTLAELRQDGKLIGIISHVPVLRDRIDVRIRVMPGPGGNSRLLGPGCTASS